MEKETVEGNCCLDEDFAKICLSLNEGHSVIITGELAIEEAIPAQLSAHFLGTKEVASTIYKGSTKKFLVEIANKLDIPTEDQETGKALTVDALKDELTQNMGSHHLLICPEAKRLPTSIRYWLEDCMAVGVVIAAFSVTNPKKDVFLNMVEIELQLPDDLTIREVMKNEAAKLGLEINSAKLAKLQPLAGRNPKLARSIIRKEKLGLKQDEISHTQYLVIMPIVVAMLMAFGVVRFIGMGTRNRGLYIFGGVALVSGMTLRQLGSIRGARKLYGE